MASFIEPTTTDVCRTLFADMAPSDAAFATGFTEEQTEALVNALADLDEPPTVHVLVMEDVLKWLRRDFHLASTVADLVYIGALSMRVTEDAIANTTITTDGSVVSLVTPNGRTAGLATDNEEFVRSMREQASEAWEAATAADLRTPPRSQVYETLPDELGSEVEADYRSMLDAVGATRSGYRSTDDDLDEVELNVLAGAKQDVQLFELSNWGERVGLASKATFSRTKNRLEDHGLVDTEKVPVEIGRPRQRLVLSEQLRGYEASELPAAVRDELRAAPA